MESQVVSVKFVKYWFDSRFLEGFKFHCDKNIYFYVPMGSSCCNELSVLPKEMVLPTFIRYTQRNWETCAFSGLASTLHAIGLHDIAKKFEKLGHNVKNAIDIDSQLQLVNQNLRKTTNGNVGGQIVYYKRPKNVIVTRKRGNGIYLI